MSAEIGDNSVDSVAAAQLRAFVERIESVESEITDRNDDKKQIYGEVRSSGLDAKIVKKIVAIRRQDPATRSEEETLLDIYMRALGGLS
jgi:uncharacterized protein (UPF0335 family)